MFRKKDRLGRPSFFYPPPPPPQAPHAANKRGVPPGRVYALRDRKLRMRITIGASLRGLGHGGGPPPPPQAAHAANKRGVPPGRVYALRAWGGGGTASAVQGVRVQSLRD